MTNPAAHEFLWAFAASESKEATSLYFEPVLQNRAIFVVLVSSFWLLLATVTMLAGSRELSLEPLRIYPLMWIPVVLGGLSGLGLLREGWTTRRGLAARICFFSAGFVMLMETLLLFVHRS